MKGHAPHVDHRVNPDKAKVTITATVPSLSKEVTIKRSVKSPRVATIDPADPKIQTIFEELQSHPEFALSRREVAKYIVTPPVQRSTDVLTLLRLDYIGDLHKALLSYANRSRREANEAERARARAESELKTARAYLLKLTLQNVYFTDNREDRENRFKGWYNWAIRSQIDQVRKVAKTVKNHWNGILAWFDSKLTNGFIEAINGLIKSAKRRA